MSFFSILLIATGLAIDALAVSISTGLNVSRKTRFNTALILAATFALFQMIMPMIGWLAGINVRDQIASYDHWLAAALLFGIGIKMIYESVRPSKGPKKTFKLEIFTLIILGIATSIDALAVGLSLSLLRVHLLMPVAVIGIITFILSFSGTLAGYRLAKLLENRIEILGGLILIAIGIRILFEHLS